MNDKLNSLGQKAFIAGSASGVISILGGIFFSQEAFFEGYLFAFMICVSVPLGALVLTTVHYLSHGAWGFVFRRQALAVIHTLPLMALLLLPIFLGIKHLYLWANLELVSQDPILLQKVKYLNVPFFQGRAVFYFVVWILVANLLERKSHAFIDDHSEEGRTHLQLVSGLCLLAVIFTITFAAFDWMMSLEPHWFSTIFGIFTIIGMVLFAMAFLIVMTAVTSEESFLKEESTIRGFHDLGNLTLALVMLWAYMGFSQFFIIWSGNLPEEIHWYLHRLGGGWQYVGTALVLFHFFVPFFLLLNRTLKQNVRALAVIALFIMAIRVVDLSWMILPTFHHEVLHLHWLHFTTPVAMVGIWFAFFTKKLKDMS